MGRIIKLEHKVRVTHLSNTCEQWATLTLRLVTTGVSATHVLVANTNAYSHGQVSQLYRSYFTVNMHIHHIAKCSHCYTARARMTAELSERGILIG